MLTVAMVLGSYLLGSIPSGYIAVRLIAGEDVRTHQSGRTGGTNAYRAAGLVAGLLTAFGDVSKAVLAVWLAQQLFPAQPMVHVVAGLATIIGHNYSVFLIETKEGKLEFGGGAGGAPTVGTAIALWAPSGLIIVPVGALILWLVGYASVTTMTAGLLAIVIFLVRGLAGLDPLQYVWFGVGAEALLLWSLRPNIKRLLAGEERLVGLRARKQRKIGEQEAA